MGRPPRARWEASADRCAACAKLEGTCHTDCFVCGSRFGFFLYGPFYIDAM